jgi:hypothetical protein
MFRKRQKWKFGKPMSQKTTKKACAKILLTLCVEKLSKTKI